MKVKWGFRHLFYWARSLALARNLALVLYSKTGWKKSKIKEPTTELKTNRPVLQELFEDIKQFKKLIKIILTYKLIG
ncbi:MAG: hypothetical protein COZ30_00270 [Candidatus Nealsonbacteria bacterium CG_4_10_14_3_um_filter_36_16]|uniref:Uncharacterized protein n=2 Tax=Bacteria candidate phyla TaxID=1783234 RepID=A0A2M7VJF4_9BACT|nr:MAG: hypothetical protein COZ30_00270 [Candidatus Nealsonbacteria bacterium CG_4_10_14_3_um_filter_36_16]PJA01972.1 MAG: hypothetical protein COX73_03240 [bacterium (Candidatus Gribaldobacteria) CG_4_10_14_0_2_um_filter_36_18]